ncbi:MAG TPA: tryptophan synthase subunit alpha [Limnobacter sp.]|uniref:tryptophan synthase subunit alpha n=1 Tax=Limnobacter sp. TaxID=2003368 RepID=UPI002E339990|nr:tryptophan synthase subunit alpha [Limnobacter sp.]HEX5486682.1 tryptophan synthase subunit alpha [Limnobacter sp.]
MSRIKQTFERLAKQGRKGLIPFVTGGDPEPTHTVDVLLALAKAGADVIELGVPFSDPMADGPVIQRSSERALSKGISTKVILDYVREFRKSNQDTPIVLMGYANPIERMGEGAFVAAAHDAGVDGVLVVDYPPEESLSFADLLRKSGMDPIFLLAPTSSDERIKKVAQTASGYVYYVSLKGVTGAQHLNTTEVSSKLPVIRQHTQVPVGVGFGIRDAESACRVASSADAVVIGSALIQALEARGEQSPADTAYAFLHPIRLALDDAYSA